MAHQKRRARGAPVVHEPLNSFRFVILIMTGFLALIGFFVVSTWRSRANMNAERQRGQFLSANYFSSPDSIPSGILKNLDAILVLGGGAPESLEVPPMYVQRRADDAAKVVQQHKKLERKGKTKLTLDTHLPILCLSAGTAHLPQVLSPDGLPIWESTSCAAYLAKQHGLTENVFVETTSYDTIGNAFFTRTSHTDVNGWRRLLVITNEFHINRTAAIFDWIFVECSRHDEMKGKPKKQDLNPYEMYYLSSPNVGLSEEAIAARREREEQSAIHVREHLSKTYTTLSQLWGFLNRDHALYTASKLIERGRGSGNDPSANDLVKKSYGLKDGLNYS